MSKTEPGSAARAYRSPSGGATGKKIRVEIPVIRANRNNSPTLPIYSGQEVPSSEPERESLTRTVERSPFRAGLGLGLGFAAGTALFRVIGVLIVYGIVFAVLFTLFKNIF
jgi:hypothetical protein